MRNKRVNAYAKWTEEDQAEAVKLFNRGIFVKDIALHLQRSRGAIRSRLRHLGLIIFKKDAV